MDAALASLPEGVEAADELLEGDVVEELAALDERECDLLVAGRAATGRCGGCCSAACRGG